eukprot:8058299-Pyramimonas_sp.AAC.1
MGTYTTPFLSSKGVILSPAAPTTPGPPASPPSSSTGGSEGCSTLYFASVTTLGKKAWPHILAQQAHHSYDFMGFVEAHIGESLKQKWSGKFKAQ